MDAIEVKTVKGTPNVYGATAICPFCYVTNSFSFGYQLLPNQAEEYIAKCYSCQSEFTLRLQGIQVETIRRNNKKLYGSKYREEGQALVELAISMVFILLLLAGVVEFGIIFFQYVQLRDAAQEGGLNGAICQDNELIYNRVVHSSYTPIDLPNDPNVFVDVPVNDGIEGGAITVQVSYRHKVFMPFMSVLLGEHVTLNASVTDTILTVDGCR